MTQPWMFSFLQLEPAGIRSDSSCDDSSLMATVLFFFAQQTSSSCFGGCMRMSSCIPYRRTHTFKYSLRLRSPCHSIHFGKYHDPSATHAGSHRTSFWQRQFSSYDWCKRKGIWAHWGHGTGVSSYHIKHPETVGPFTSQDEFHMQPFCQPWESYNDALRVALEKRANMQYTVKYTSRMGILRLTTSLL